MNYKYEIINYDQNTPAKVMYLNLSSETHKTELHWHREPELVYVIEGQAECPRNGETTIVNEGGFYPLQQRRCSPCSPCGRNKSASCMYSAFV